MEIFFGVIEREELATGRRGGTRRFGSRAYPVYFGSPNPGIWILQRLCQLLLCQQSQRLRIAFCRFFQRLGPRL